MAAHELSKRSLIAGLLAGATGAATLALPAALAARSGDGANMTGQQTHPAPMLRPPRLRPGAVIGLISPSGATFDPDDLVRASQTVEALGFVPKVGAHAGDVFGYLGGRDGDRAADINAMFADPEVNGILAVRGGWGAARLLDQLDYGLIRANPKPLMGFSDVTGLHLALQAQAGLISFHGANAVNAWGPITQASFDALLVDGDAVTFVNPAAAQNRLVATQWRTTSITGGIARGRLIGGNLTVLAALAGTPFIPDLEGAILVLEDVNEAEYRIDRMLTQLRLAGLLKRVAGVIFGQCTRCADPGAYGGFPLSVVLAQHLEPLGIPAFHGAAFGHIDDQPFLPLGADVEMDADACSFRLLAPAVT